MNSRARPGTIQVGAAAFVVQRLRDFLLRLSFDEQVDTCRRTVSISPLTARDQDDAIGLQALLHLRQQFSLRLSVFVDQLPSKAVAGRAALPESEGDQPALSGKHLRRQFPAVLASHCALHAFDDRRAETAIVLELLCAVVNRDAASLQMNS